MTAARADLESKLEDSCPSDDEIIEFINENIHDEIILTEYFSKLTRPISARILTLPFPYVDERYNLLSYSVIKHTSYFKYLVKLATPEAIDEALSEDPLNPVSLSPFQAIFGIQKGFGIADVISLIQKASQDVINAELVKRAVIVGQPTLAIAFAGADNLVILELLKKSSDEAVKAAALIIAHQRNLLHVIINNKLPMFIVDMLLSKLNSEIIDHLMLMPGASGRTPFNLIFFEIHDEYFVSLAETMIKHTSQAALNVLAKQDVVAPIDLLPWLLVKQCAPRIVELLLSKLDKSVVEDLASTGGLIGLTPLFFASMRDGTNSLGLPPVDIAKQTDRTALQIINNLSAEILSKLIKNAVNSEKMLDTARKSKIKLKLSLRQLEESLNYSSEELLENMSKNNAVLFNALVNKLLLAGYQINLTTKSIYRLDVFNLSRYLIQHPEIDINQLRTSKAHSFIVNWKYKPNYIARLNQAENISQDEIAFSLNSYRYLKDNYLVEPVARMVLDYLDRDNTVIDRVNYEIVKDKHPSNVTELKSVYAEIKKLFSHDKELKFRKDESAIVLDYFADYSNMADIAVAEANKAEKKKISLSLMAKSIFHPKKTQEKKEEKKEISESSKVKFRFRVSGVR